MNKGALRLFFLLAGAQLFVLLTTIAIGIAVAPRMLVLSAEVVRGSWWMVPATTFSLIVLVVLQTAFVVRRAVGAFTGAPGLSPTVFLVEQPPHLPHLFMLSIRTQSMFSFRASASKTSSQR